MLGPAAERNQIFLDSLDVSVSGSARTVVTRYGKTVQSRVITVRHILAIAWWWSSIPIQP